MITFDEIPSTNLYLKENYERFPDGTVVVALTQTMGYGREGRRWYSPRGGLWFSVLFKPRQSVDPHFYTKLFAVAVLRALERLRVRADLKWPNDVYVHGKKLAGILAEGIFEGRRVKALIVGVGVNVNNEIPKELAEKAISLKALTSKEWELMTLLRLILRYARSLLRKYSKKKEALTRVWKGMLMQKEGDEILFLDEGKEKWGRIVKIASDHLLVESNGELKKVCSLSLP